MMSDIWHGQVTCKEIFCVTVDNLVDKSKFLDISMVKL